MSTHYENGVRKPCLSVPRFQSNWSPQMAKWLISIQKEFPGPHEWVDWIVTHAVEICESWGDRRKAGCPQYVMTEAVGRVADMLPPDLYGRIIDLIDDAVDIWSNS